MTLTMPILLAPIKPSVPAGSPSYADPYWANVMHLFQPRVGDTLLSEINLDKSDNAMGAGTSGGTVVFSATTWTTTPNDFPCAQFNNGQLTWDYDADVMPGAGEHWCLEYKRDADVSSQTTEYVWSLGLIDSPNQLCLGIYHNGNNIDIRYSTDGTTWVTINSNMTGTTTKRADCVNYDGTYISWWEGTSYDTRTNVGTLTLAHGGGEKLSLGDFSDGAGDWDGRLFATRWTVGHKRFASGSDLTVQHDFLETA